MTPIPTRLEHHKRVRDLAERVGNRMNCAAGDVMGRCKTKSIAAARGLVMYLARKHLRMSLHEIGDAFGNYDHTTALYAVRTTEQRLKEMPWLAAVAAEVEGTITRT